MNKDYTKCKLKDVEAPVFSKKAGPVFLNDMTMIERKNKVLSLMEKRNLDAIAVYADLEHGSNFEYLTGFLPRFEEALLILHQSGEAYLLLGNENTKMVKYTRLPAKLIHVPFFSLPNQPMEDDADVKEYLKRANICKDMQIGLVGWKNFTSKKMDNRKLFDIPYYIVDAFQTLGCDVENHCDLMIGGSEGARVCNNANEIAHYEFRSSLASDAVQAALDHVQVGMSELEVASYMQVYGQRNSVVTICATGERFDKANLYPSQKKVQLQDKMSLTVGLKGGLTSRAGYAVEKAEQLPLEVHDYIERLASPYFYTIATWLDHIHVGMKGKELYDLIEEVLPKQEYHWHLNPGHLCGDEEWMSSPMYPNSEEVLKSGMLLQTDIIPSVSGYGGVSCESGVVLANAELRKQIQMQYPELWDTFQKRRNYIMHTLGIRLSDDILPMNDTVAYYRPFFLNRTLAFVKE